MQIEEIFVLYQTEVCFEKQKDTGEDSFFNI